MKKRFLFPSLVLVKLALATNHVQAQNSESVTTAVSINLADVISLDVGGSVSEGSINFSYANIADYNSAKSVTVPNSLVVISSKNFDIKVKSEGANFVNGSNLIPVDVLQVKAVAGGTLEGAMNEITLSTTDQVLVSNASIGFQQSLNIAYTISAEKASKVLLGKPKGTYTQKVIYTATAL